MAKGSSKRSANSLRERWDQRQREKLENDERGWVTAADVAELFPGSPSKSIEVVPAPEGSFSYRYVDLIAERPAQLYVPNGMPSVEEYLDQIAVGFFVMTGVDMGPAARRQTMMSLVAYITADRERMRLYAAKSSQLADDFLRMLVGQVVDRATVALG